MALASCSQPTYEELKLSISAWPIMRCKGSQPTYEELKPCVPLSATLTSSKFPAYL